MIFTESHFKCGLETAGLELAQKGQHDPVHHFPHTNFTTLNILRLTNFFCTHHPLHIFERVKIWTINSNQGKQTNQSYTLIF